MKNKHMIWSRNWASRGTAMLIKESPAAAPVYTNNLNPKSKVKRLLKINPNNALFKSLLAWEGAYTAKQLKVINESYERITQKVDST